MRTVYLSNSIFPSRTANSIHVMKMCQAFARNGHEVVLLARGRSGGEARVNDPFEFYGVEPNFMLEKTPWVEIKGRAYLYALLTAIKAKRFKPDVVYGRCLHSCYVSTLFGLPVIYEAHVLPEQVGRKTKWVHRRLLQSKRLQRLVAISEALKQAYCQEYDVPESKVLVAHDAADIPRLSGNAERLPKNGRLHVGYVGHLYPGKGMEIIAPLIGACPWADFHIIGGMDSDVDYWKGQLQDARNVTFHGFVPHAETDAYRQACDILLAPYQRSVSTCGGGDIARWMSPLKIFEYMAAGKPIVCSDLPVLREVLRHDENAWLCTPDDPKEWIEALTLLRDNPKIRTQLGKQARQEFEAKYTWTARAVKVLDGINSRSSYSA